MTDQETATALFDEVKRLRAEVAALKAENEMARQDLAAQGCMDHACLVQPPTGWGTNGGCSCSPHKLGRELRKARAENAALRQENAMLKVTTELPNLRDRVRDQRRELTRLTAELCDAPMVRAKLRASKAEVAALREWQAKASEVLRGRLLGPSRNKGGSAPFCLVCKLWPHSPVCPMGELLASAEGKR